MLRKLDQFLLLGLLTNVASGKDKALGDFDWTTIEPSWSLNFSSCYDDLQCARLLAPLDWLAHDQSHGQITKQDDRTVTLALIKQPAVVSASDSTYGGTVIVNPGGPGDSGVLHILKNGLYLQSMMDSEKKHFEVLSFDPRGMAMSTPIADCFTSEVVRSLTAAQQAGLGQPDHTSNASLTLHRAAATALGMQCAKPQEGGIVIQEFMSTASVAHDMLLMVDKIQEHTENLVQGDSRQGQKPLSTSRLTDGDKKPGRILYYGTSYGTLLGNTFLSMFPNRVHRMVLDGVVVPEDYTAGDWSPNLEDTSKTFDYFYQACYDVGSKCALSQPSDKSWRQVKARIEDLINRLNVEPLSVARDGVPPTVIPGSYIRSLMLDPVYAPLDLYDGLANTLADVLHGNYTSLLDGLGISPQDGLCKPSKVADYRWMHLAGQSVRCGDADDMRYKDNSYWRRYIGRCIENSPEIGALWADIGCAGWQVRPKLRFTGPFTSPASTPRNVESGIAPSAPVLFLTSRYDPVTPLRSAFTASKSHPGSRVLIQNSVGHCAMLSSPSECTKKVMRAYLDTGELPTEGAECEADCIPWGECPHRRAKLPR